MMRNRTGSTSHPRWRDSSLQASCVTVCRPEPLCGNPDSLKEVWAGTLQDWYEEMAKIELLSGKLGPMAKSLAAIGAMLRPFILGAQVL